MDRSEIQAALTQVFGVRAASFSLSQGPGFGELSEKPTKLSLRIIYNGETLSAVANELMTTGFKHCTTVVVLRHSALSLSFEPGQEFLFFIKLKTNIEDFINELLELVRKHHDIEFTKQMETLLSST